MEIFKNRQYHFILKDGSLIRVSFKFSGSLLESQNLLWWPCPIRDFQKLCSNPEQTDLVMDFLDGYIKKQDLLMRSPIRIDVDISNDTVEHPIYHVHLENCDTRIAVDRPLCINGFLRFILHNFYPQEKIDFSDWQFIKFKTSSPANSYIDFLNVGYNIFHN